MKRLLTLENRFEADLVSQALEAEGIEFVVKTFHDTAYNGLFETQKGYALLLVEEARQDEAREIVDQVRASVDAETGD